MKESKKKRNERKRAGVEGGEEELEMSCEGARGIWANTDQTRGVDTLACHPAHRAV